MVPTTLKRNDPGRPIGFAGDVDAVLLDAAGTLIRTRVPVGETYARIAGRYGAATDAGRLTHAFSGALGAMPALAFKWHSRQELHRLEYQWWRTLVRRVLSRAETSIGDFDNFFDALYSYYADAQAWVCYPEVADVLGALRANGFRLAVVSNFDSRLPGILEKLRIRTMFDAVVYSSEAGSAKPDRAIFEQALDKIGVDPARAVHVGDSPSADLAGARRTGIAGFLLQRDQPPQDLPANAICSLADLRYRLRQTKG